MKKLLAVLLSVTLVLCTVIPALAESAEKDETVYILAEPDGATRRIIVSDWLSNPESADVLNDISNLTDIENVKGDEAFSGSAWQAGGHDIYYQGESTSDLPIEMNIHYTLDGQAIEPEDLAGKDGHVVIRFDYEVVQAMDVTVDNESTSVKVPFAVITAALLENDVFSNIEAVNGHLVNDGDRTVLVGLALPGVQDSLDLDRENIEIPEYIEIEADVKNFALPITVTLATSEVFAQIDGDTLEDGEDLKQALNDLTDGMNQLLEGSNALYEGLTTLSTGAQTLEDGVSELSEGLITLTANNSTLIDGSTQVFNTLLDTINQQLAATGADLPALTIENYSETLSGLIDAMSEAGIAQQARTQVEQAVDAQADQVLAGVTQAVQAEVQAQVTETVQANVLSQVLETVNMTLEDYQSAKQAGLIPEAQAGQIESALQQQMNSESVKALIAQNVQEQMASESVQTLIADNTEAQIQALIDQNMASDDVQKQIAQNVAQYQEISATLSAIKAQLDSYNTFHTGLIAYTQGASAAAEGASQIAENMPELMNGIASLEAGALSLKDGLSTFNEAGIEKLSQLMDETIEPTIHRARGMIEAARIYQNYSGIADDMEGSVRFIWRTDAIKP